MADPDDIRRQMEEAERARAQYLQDEFNRTLANFNADIAAAREGSMVPSVMPHGMLGGVIGRHERNPDNPDPADTDLAAEALPNADREALRSREAQRLAASRLAGDELSLRSPSEYDDTLGGLIPSIGAQVTPGLDGRGVVLPETEDFEAYGDAPGAAILAEPEAKRRKAARLDRAIDIGNEERSWRAREDIRRRAAELSDRVPLAGLTAERMDWGRDPVTAAEGATALMERRAQRQREAQQAASQGLESSPIGSLPMAALAGAFQGGTQGGGDEALGLVDMLGGDSYRQSRDTYRSIFDQLEQEHPTVFNGSRLASGIASGFAAPGAGIARANSLRGAMAAGAGSGALWGGVNGFLDSEADDASGALQDAGQAATIGAAMGAPLGAAGHGVSRISRWLAGQADDVAARSNPIRNRAAGVRTVGMQRLVDDLPGGSDAFAADVRRLGISGEGEIHAPEVAGERARAIAEESGKRIRDIIEEMGRHESAAGVRATPGLADDVTSAARRGARVNPGAPTANAPYRVSGPQGSVRTDRIVSELDRIIAEAEGVPGAESRLEAARELADDLRSRGRISFDLAQRIKRNWDSLINWNASASPTSRLTPLQADRRAMRTALQSAMDQAVEENAPHLADTYRQSRRDFQVSHLIDRLAHDNELREAANRLISPTDYAAAIQGATGGGGLTRQALMAIANRFLRTREASAAATAMERGAHRLRAAPEAAARQIDRAARVAMPTAARIGSAMTGTEAPAPSQPDPSIFEPDEFEPQVPEAQAQNPDAMTDEQWLQMANQPAAETDINPDELSDDEWLQMVEQ